MSTEGEREYYSEPEPYTATGYLNKIDQSFRAYVQEKAICTYGEYLAHATAIKLMLQRELEDSTDLCSPLLVQTADYGMYVYNEQTGEEELVGDPLLGLIRGIYVEPSIFFPGSADITDFDTHEKAKKDAEKKKLIT